MTFLRYRDLKPKKGIPFTRQHLKRMQALRQFPGAVPFGDNTEVYIEEEVDKWVADRIAARDAKLAEQPQPQPAGNDPAPGRKQLTDSKQGARKKPAVSVKQRKSA